MKLLFRIAVQNRRIFALLIVTVTSMIMLSVASQVEIFTLRVITEKGPDFFELFAPINEKGKLKPKEYVDKSTVDERWKDIDINDSGSITKQEAVRYMNSVKTNDRITKLLHWLNRKLDLLNNLKSLALMVVLVAVFKAVTQFISKYTQQLVGIKVSRALRQRYFEHLQSMPMSFYHKYHAGNLSARVMGDASTVASAINSFFTNYLQTPFVILTTLALLFATSWRLSLVFLIGSPLIVYPIIFIAKKVKKIAKQMQRNQEGFASVILDFLAGIQTVKIFAMEDCSLQKYCKQNDHMAFLEEKNARYTYASRPLLHMIGSLVLAAVVLYGMYVLRLNISELLFFCGLLYVMYEPIKKFAEENIHIQRGIAAAERMFEVLSQKPDIQDHDGAIEMTGFQHSIEFRDVWFKYEDEWVLKGVSFTVAKGETVALVGPTGAGKSTIALLLPRLYDVQHGEILIDGKPLQSYTQKSLRETLSFVPQKPFLFYDTIAENISFGRDFSREEIKSAADKAHASEFVETLPKTYDTMLDEAGKNLSGGQQQRLAIARALVKNAPILVMDEATSALDAVSENYIKEAIMNLHGSVTQILIAHRLTTIEHADKIIYLEKGHKIAEGNKDTLMEKCQNFRLMWEVMMNTKH
ncbi:MAG: ABC transporter ATP-binding protein [Chlamydiota bacterium]